MARHAATQELLKQSTAILRLYNPMTVRQTYYQLVSRYGLENSQSAYKRICRLLVDGRKDGSIPWDWIEDRLRQPRHVPMWADLSSFGNSAMSSYRRDVWQTQPHRFETWVEKDALSGIFEDELEPYGVTLNVGRGYDGWTSIKDAAERFGENPTTILYFGDFDPSGEDMVRSLRDRLAWFGAIVEIVKCALTREDIEQYSLPPNPTKTTDTRRARFIAEHGDISVELDALPVDVLRARIVSAVEKLMDLDALSELRDKEEGERRRLRSALAKAAR